MLVSPPNTNSQGDIRTALTPIDHHSWTYLTPRQYLANAGDIQKKANDLLSYYKDKTKDYEEDLAVIMSGTKRGEVLMSAEINEKQKAMFEEHMEVMMEIHKQFEDLFVARYKNLYRSWEHEYVGLGLIGSYIYAEFEKKEQDTYEKSAKCLRLMNILLEKHIKLLKILKSIYGNKVNWNKMTTEVVKGIEENICGFSHLMRLNERHLIGLHFCSYQPCPTETSKVYGMNE